MVTPQRLGQAVGVRGLEREHPPQCRDEVRCRDLPGGEIGSFGRAAVGGDRDGEPRVGEVGLVANRQGRLLGPRAGVAVEDERERPDRGDVARPS